MHSENLLRSLLFAVAFSVGASALSAAILCNELLRYMDYRRLETVGVEKTEKLKQLSSDYDVLLEQVRKDPNISKRIASVTLGIEPNEPNVAYPKLTADRLAAARRVLSEQSDEKPVVGIPAWLKRLSEPRKRLALFLSGAGLIILSFVCFAPVKVQKKKPMIS